MRYSAKLSSNVNDLCILRGTRTKSTCWPQFFSHTYGCLKTYITTTSPRLRRLTRPGHNTRRCTMSMVRKRSNQSIVRKYSNYKVTLEPSFASTTAIGLSWPGWAPMSNKRTLLNFQNHINVHIIVYIHLMFAVCQDITSLVKHAFM